MPAPAVYVLAVVGTIGAAFAFRHFVYEPHIAPKVEQWAEEFLARRRAKRMQRQGLIPVPASIPIPLRRRRGSKRSDFTRTDSDDSFDGNGDSRGFSSLGRRPGPSRSSLDLEDFVAREVGEWRSEVERSQTASSLRHRKNPGVHTLDQSINPISHPPMSPTHVITDTSAPTTPTSSITLPSTLPSPPPQISPIGAADSVLTLHPTTVNGNTAPARPSPLSQTTTPTESIVHAVPPPTPASPSRLTRSVSEHAPPLFTSPVPSLSQSYPQELDQERGVELLSPPSSGTSSPFSTFSPFVAPQPLSPFTAIQPLDHPSPEIRSWPSSPASRTLSPFPVAATNTTTTTSTTASNYQSFASSPAPQPSQLSSPANVARSEPRSPSPPPELLSYLSSPSPINFTSPDAISPRSPHSEISDLDFGSDIDVISEQGSDISWAGVSSASGSSNRR